MDQELATTIDRYIDTLFAPHDEALEAARHAIREAQMPDISVSPGQGKLLHVLALLCRARKILEIGTLGGYSAIWMARALPADGYLVTIEHNEMHARVAQKNIARAGLQDRIELRQGVALDVLSQLACEQAGPFDMIFIDADKQPYVQYFEHALRLAQPGTLIVADNVLRSGDVLDSTSTDPNVIGIARFNGALAISPIVSAIILQMVGRKGHDGIALAVVKDRAVHVYDDPPLVEEE